MSHSNIKTKKVWNANLQRVRAIVDGRPVRLKLCTRCIRSELVTKRVEIKSA